jgi:Undecaprenyl-phosphate glucose phosphotransferase
VVTRTLDFFVMVVAGFLTIFAAERVHHSVEGYAILTIAVACVFTVLSSINNSTDIRSLTQLMKSILSLGLNSVLVFLAFSGVFFAAKIGEDYSRYWIVATILIGFMFSAFIRVVIYINFKRCLDLVGRNVLIAGLGDLSETLFRRMTQDRVYGFRPIAFCDLSISGSESSLECFGLPVLNGLEQLLDFIEAGRIGKLDDKGELKVDEVWITLPLSNKKRLVSLQKALRNTAAKVYYVPEMHDLGLRKYEVETLLNLPIMEWTEVKERTIDRRAKRLIDLVIATLSLVLLTPFLFIIGILVKLDSPGTVLYSQKRYGLDGKEFNMLKFRSMLQHACGDNESRQAAPEDERVTKLGRFIRKYSIDELPQLVNVLQGDMSVVGPRPHAAEHNEFYRDKIDGYMSRHRAIPGMTGWAQVNGYRGETPYLKDMESRVRYDLEYIRGWSLWFDLTILVKTVAVIFTAKNAY